jgi:hypothetical protein
LRESVRTGLVHPLQEEDLHLFTWERIPLFHTEGCYSERGINGSNSLRKIDYRPLLSTTYHPPLARSRARERERSRTRRVSLLGIGRVYMISSRISPSPLCLKSIAYATVFG